MRKKVLSLEALIGGGKSVQLGMLKDFFRDDGRVAFVDEPVAEWEDSGLLGAFYDGTLPAASFQMYALQTRQLPLFRALSSDADVVVTERSVWSDYLVFARTAGMSSRELEAYAAALDAVQGHIEHLSAVDLTVVYLELDVDTAMERIRRRGRKSETGVPTAYMDRLKANHELFVGHAQTNTLAAQCRGSVAAAGRPNSGFRSDAVVLDGSRAAEELHLQLVALLEQSLSAPPSPIPSEVFQEMSPFGTTKPTRNASWNSGVGNTKGYMDAFPLQPHDLVMYERTRERSSGGGTPPLPVAASRR